MENNHEKSHEHSDVELYGDPGIASKDHRVPLWLTINNWFWVFFGLFFFYYYINGSHGWLDRGYWAQLQRAANTTYPFTTREIMEEEHDKKLTAKQRIEQLKQESQKTSSQINSEK